MKTEGKILDHGYVDGKPWLDRTTLVVRHKENRNNSSKRGVKKWVDKKKDENVDRWFGRLT